MESKSGVSKIDESSALSQRHKKPKKARETDTIAWCYAHRCEFIDYSDREPDLLYKPGTGVLIASQGKKLKNIYHLFYDIDLITKASYNACKGKGKRWDIVSFKSSYLDRIMDFWRIMYYEQYIPGEYRIKKIWDPKERDIMIAPFFPDRIVHHLVILILGRHWQSIFIYNTYACIKGRGIHKCVEDVHFALVNDPKGTRYCLKIDVRKFYDNVDHAALKRIIRYTITDEKVLRLLDLIIDSNGKDKGLPIGNFTSQFLANLYLSYFDHFVKEVLKVKYYYRYMDDIVVLDDSKERLHWLLDMFGLYLGAELKLEIKPNWQIFPVDARGIDYVGFKQNHYGILLRKSILMRFYKKWNATKDKYHIVNENDFKHLYSSEYGWIIRCSEEHSKFIFNKCIQDDKQRAIDCGLAQ